MKKGYIIPVLKEIKRKNSCFADYLEKLRIPATFSVMALLSSDKVNLFSDKFLEFVEYLIVSEYNSSEDSSSYAAYIIDKIT